jgi:hypothetical protein
MRSALFLGLFLYPGRQAFFRRLPLVSVEIPDNGAKLATDLATIYDGPIKFPLTFAIRWPTICGMSKASAKNEPTGYPELAVRAEVIGRFFSPPLASSTFHDFVNKGKIVPMKGIRGM